MKREHKRLSGWGHRRWINAQVTQLSPQDPVSSIAERIQAESPCALRGNGRSYGDSALAERLIDIRGRRYFLEFDDKSGLLQVQAGVLLSDILDAFVPRGWFLAVTPGTRYITVAGAIAADVHGKNHHHMGCFSECVEQIEILDHKGITQLCSKLENSHLFRATCGGQGLTGVILSARIRLIKIGSAWINQTTYKTKNLEDTFNCFDRLASAEYSVAWIDCLARGSQLGRAHVSTGEFLNDGALCRPSTRRRVLRLPFYLPSYLLNRITMRCFNSLYYHRQRAPVQHSRVHYESFFYPLDAILDWNKGYGKQGFVQYQFVLPLETSVEGMREILRVIANSGKGSFLAVLKLYGEANQNYLSFPLKGYSLALDFKYDDQLESLLQQLDQLVSHYRGRHYLAKDSRLSADTFARGYPHVSDFRAYRQTHDLPQIFMSDQARRLKL